MTKKLPIGVSDFKELIENEYYYVDKSLLIKEISDAGKVILVPRPRRFGKTLNLSMLRYFYEKSDESQAHLFANLKIWQDEKFRAMQGQFPVVFLTLKGVVYTNYQDIYEKLQTLVATEFTRHKYLLEGSTLEPFEKELYERIRQGKASHVEFTDSLYTLVMFLNRYHKMKVVVLLDEYDVPVQASFIHSFYSQTMEFLKPFLTSAFKDNELIEKGIITGILTLAKAGIFTGLNNLDIFNLTSPFLADKFGFSENEATELLRHYSVSDPQSVKEWYNGYIFGTTYGMYNPWSILKCAQNKGSLEIYWANTSDNILLRRLVAQASSVIKSELELLLTDQVIAKTIEESIVFPDIDTQQDLIWSILLFTGYLTYRDYQLHEGKKVCSLVIPNIEIKFLFRDVIRKLFLEGVVGGQVQEFLQSMIEGKVNAFSQLLQGFVLKSMSFYDVDGLEPEKSYHLFVLGLLVTLSDTYVVRSNQESGLGRYDILLIPKQKNRPGIIIELKKVWKSSEDALEIGAQKALDQIHEKKYAQQLYDQSIETIIAYGIAFAGKNLFVKSTSIKKP